MMSVSKVVLLVAVVLSFTGAQSAIAQQTSVSYKVSGKRPEGPCDVYAAAGNACVAAYSTTRAMYAAYDGPLYQVLRQSDGKTLNIGVVPSVAAPVPVAGGYADAAAQDRFCANTYCWISVLYDQSSKRNHLTQAPRGGWSGPAMGGFDSLPLADRAPVMVMGNKVYGVFLAPGMGLRNNDPNGTAVDDQSEGMYWVIDGKHFNSGCCFDFGNAETDSFDDGNGTMETSYFGDNAASRYHGSGAGPWIMIDVENNLLGCVNSAGPNDCAKLPSITSRFVTAIAKGEPHHSVSMGGDAQHGPLTVLFDGPRINATYDPMRKQGAIVLGRGGDNSVASQGTFYEGAMTAAGTFPSDATDKRVQANVVEANYRESPLSLASTSVTEMDAGLQTFSPGSSQNTTLTFTNTTGVPAKDVDMRLSAPNQQWISVVSGTTKPSKSFTGTIAPGASVSAVFRLTSGSAPLNGDLVAKLQWTNVSDGARHGETLVEKVRNVSPVRINQFRISSGLPVNSTDSFIELYNAGPRSIDISNWTLNIRPIKQAMFSALTVPAGTKLASKGFYLFGLSNSGLAVSAAAGESTLHVTSVSGMSVGDSIAISDGTTVDTTTIAAVGTAAATNTTLWQPLPDGPVITIPSGSTNVPVTSTSGFVVGQKIALGHGATYPAVANTIEQYEVATVTAVGEPGTQAHLETDAKVGETNLKVSSVSNISVGDKIRLDIDSVGHGVETVTVAHVGSSTTSTTLHASASAGATSIQVRSLSGLTTGRKVILGDAAHQDLTTITAIRSTSVDFNPALAYAHAEGEEVKSPGTGLDLANPLRFHHSANLPFSDRGTGISFTPPTTFAHSSNEPIEALGSGLKLDRPLRHSYPIHTAVRDHSVTTEGYQGKPEPSQWFGGPALAIRDALLGKFDVSVRAGSMVLRDASGLVVDSLNYGGLVDPWAAKGYQATSGPDEGGCYVLAPGYAEGYKSAAAAAAATNTSSGRYPDGADTDSNCTDFQTQTSAPLSAAASVGATNIKVANVSGFHVGQEVMIDSGSDVETRVIATVGTEGATAVDTVTSVGATGIKVADAVSFKKGQQISIGLGANSEEAIVKATDVIPVWRSGADTITVSAPLSHAHEAGAQVSGSGITLTMPLTKPHAQGAQVYGEIPTPGAPNHYSKRD